MFSFDKGKKIAKIVGGRNNGEILRLREIDENTAIRKKLDKVCLDKKEKFQIIPDSSFSQVVYCCGPRNSGKTTFCLHYIKNYLKVNRSKDFFLFSRTNYENDPAYEELDLHPMQIEINEELIENPVDIEKEIKDGCIIFFDDCHTINNDKIKKEIDKLMKDIIEVGRKLKITIVITNHLVIPDERKFARCIMNEMTLMCVFPRGGSQQQIKYCLQKYFDYTKSQSEEFLKTNSRWLCFYKDYPKIVISDTEALVPQ
jgi:hypothetical protein